MTSSYRPSGFSLVELLTTFAIAAILLVVAIPGFTSFIRSNRADVQVQAIVNAFNYARSEAVKRSQLVYVTAQDISGWQHGWRVWVDGNGNGTYDSGVDTELLVSAEFSGTATLSAGAVTEVRFDRLGNYFGLGVGNSTVFSYRVGADYCQLGRDIVINHLGRVTVTRGACS